MKSDIFRPIYPFILFGALLISGCSAKIEGWSQEALRSEEFSIEDVNHEGLALLPVIVLEQPYSKNGKTGGRGLTAPYTPAEPGSEVEEEEAHDSLDAYRVIFGEILLSEIQARRPALKIVSPFDALKQLNDQGLAGAYLKFNRDFSKRGLDDSLLKSFSKALRSRYLFIGQAVLTESKPETSLTFVWTFGRKSVLRSTIISGQIWDSVSGKQVWQGSGVGYNRPVIYEGYPLIEEIASRAVEELLKSILPANLPDSN